MFVLNVQRYMTLTHFTPHLQLSNRSTTAPHSIGLGLSYLHFMASTSLYPSLTHYTFGYGSLSYPYSERHSPSCTHRALVPVDLLYSQFAIQIMRLSWTCLSSFENSHLTLRVLVIVKVHLSKYVMKGTSELCVSQTLAFCQYSVTLECLRVLTRMHILLHRLLRLERTDQTVREASDRVLLPRYPHPLDL